METTPTRAALGWLHERAGSRVCAHALALVLLLALPPAAGAATPGYTDADYLRFADRIVQQLDGTWSDRRGYYESGDPSLDSRYNAALLTVHAVAAAHGHTGPSRKDARAVALARRLTRSPPFFTGRAPTPVPTMFHAPGWLGTMSGGYSVMDKAIDPKVAEGLQMAWRARHALGLPRATERAIAEEIDQVAHGPFFRFPLVRLNQINWPLELAAYDAAVTGRSGLLRDEYGLQVRRFVRGIPRPWLSPRTRTSSNLSPSYRFRYSPSGPPSSATNLDSPEYANMTLHFLSFYEDALRAGMAPLTRGEMRLLRAWVQRDLFGYWTHSGFLSWDTGLGLRRWMKGKTWAYAQQGLLTIATATRFQRDRRYGPWAKALFDRGLDLYLRSQPAGALPRSDLYGLRPHVRAVKEDRFFAARMASNAMRAVAGGLGRMARVQPPPFYAFDADVGRLSVSTPAYATAIVAVNRGAFPYGGIELARLANGSGAPVGGIGGRPPAAFGVVVGDRRGRLVLASQRGLRRDPARPPVILTRSPRGAVTRLAPYPARPAAGPFRVLEAVASRRAGDLAVTTRHRFTATAIDETWDVRRRAGRRFYRVGVLFPSWGRAASIDAELRDGTIVALAARGRPARRVPLAAVRRFSVHSDGGAYDVVPMGTAAGSAGAVSTAPQASAPDPGPTLRLEIRRGSRFERARLKVRIRPAA